MAALIHHNNLFSRKTNWQLLDPLVLALVQQVSGVGRCQGPDSGALTLSL